MTKSAPRSRLRVLLVEDSADDALIVLRALEKGESEFDAIRVASREELVTALADGPVDVVLTDVVLPSFSGLAALQLVAERAPDTPVIVVSGAVGEEQAVALMRAGASDFVDKRNIRRLPVVVERELHAARLRGAERRAREALSASEARRRSLLESLPVGVFRLSPDGHVVSANPCLLEMLGYGTEDDLAAVPCPALWIDSATVRRAAERNGIAESEIETSRRDGSVFWAFLRLRATLREDGTLAHLDGTLEDSTEKRELERAILIGKTEWERTFDAVRELIVLTDPFLRIARLNRALAERLGAEPATLVGRHWQEVLGEPLPPVDLARLVEASEHRGSIEYDYASSSLGGEFRFSTTPRLDDRGVIIGAIHVGRDVTTQRQIEELLRRQVAVDQAEAIFRTFRHEVGNAMNTLKATLTVLRESHERFDTEHRERYIVRCLETVRIAENLLGSLRRYQTLDRVDFERVRVGELLKERSDLLLATARERGIDCRLEVGDGPSLVSGDPDAMTRVLLNAIDNAATALAGRPDALLELTCRRVGGNVVVEVRDNGSGIARDHLPHVFSPLFTTKSDGSGMGLAIVQKLMLRMNGLALIRSEPGAGTTLELRFPRIDGGGSWPPVAAVS
ncbi:MAG TPA: ATP-binding protein [Thermoanaerobaculia bacterium]|nr:ATP-binding protein [Thermoanaerobaculia bacterium]HQN06004.1 ATP-binding protein [Thermoanaerobaculia bacterium]HQP85047.1 ATP-binding protein [Thermoanaerobaculia bacterium]